MDIATIGFEADTSGLERANKALDETAAKATAAEKAAKSWGSAAVVVGGNTNALGGASSGLAKNLGALRTSFQMIDTSGGSLKNTLVTSVGALAAVGEAASSSRLALVALYAAMLPIIAVAAAIAAGFKMFTAGMKAADIGEEAEQIGITTDALQALRAEASQVGVESNEMDAAMRRLTANMSGATKGGEDQIKTFQKLGVKILDAKGNMRTLSDALPEVARGLLTIENETERNAIMLELFGKSGTKMGTMLQSLAGGMDNVIASAKQQGLVLDRDVIDKWDRLKDQMAKTALQADVTWAKLGAPIATNFLEWIESLLKSINQNMRDIENRKLTMPIIAKQGDLQILEEQLATAKQLAAINPKGVGAQESITALTKRIDLKKQELVIDTQARMDADEAKAREGKLGIVGDNLNPGVKDPIPKSTTDAAAKLAEAYDKIVLNGNQAIATYKNEQATLGQSALAIATAKNELDLFNKVADAGIKLGPDQRKQLQDLAKGMAEAEVATTAAKNVFKELQGAKDFVAQQKLAQESLGLTAEAAARLKYETELLNRATQNGAVTISQDQITALKAAAGEMAAMETQTKTMTDQMEFVKDIFKDLFSDLKDALISGKNLWEAFGNAAMGVLSKIADKLLNMALDGLLSNMMPGTGGSSGSSSSSSKSGGGLGGIMNMFSGGSLSKLWGQTQSFFDGTMSQTNAAMEAAGLQSGGGGLFGSGISGMGALGAIGGGVSGIMQLMKGGGTGSTIGGIGSLVGAGVSLIPGIGQIAGPIISILSSVMGGLIGGGTKPTIYNSAYGQLGYGAGGFSTSGGAWGPDANSNTLEGPLGEMGKTMNAVLGLFGGVKDASKVWGVAMQSRNEQYGDGSSFNNATSFLVDPSGKQTQYGQGSNEHDIGMESAGVRSTINSILGGAVGEISANMRKVLGDLPLDTLFASLTTAVAEIQAFDTAISKFGKDSTAAADQIAQVDASFQGMYDTISKYNLGQGEIDKVNKERDRLRLKATEDFTYGISQGLLGISDPLQAQLNDLDKKMKEDLANNADYVKLVQGYTDQATNIETYYLEQRNALIAQFNDAALSAQKTMLNTLQDYIKSLLPGGALAGEGLQDQLSGLTGTYNAAKAQAFASPLDDAKVGAFLQAGQALLEFQKSFYGGDDRYQKARTQALQDAQAVQDAVAKGLAEGQDAIIAKGGTRDPEVTTLLDTVNTLNNQVTLLLQSQAELNAQLRRRNKSGAST